MEIIILAIILVASMATVDLPDQCKAGHGRHG
jgi:hypothetical protein